MNKTIQNIIDKANEAYSNGDVYVLSTTELSFVNNILDLDIKETTLVDSVYDIIYSKAKEKWSNDPYFNQLQSTNSGFGVSIKHDEPMGSMEELKTDDWDKWKGNHKRWLQSDKLDGCSIILTYKDGKLFTAATRGRGIEGKCILRHVSFITNIPQTISVKDYLVVRGELVCPKDEIAQMLKEVAEAEGKEQKNGRNTIAGALNRKETNVNVFNHAHFVAYWDSVNRGLNIKHLSELGFEIPYCVEITETVSEEDLIETVKTRLENSKYEIDGVILTQLDNPEEGFVSGTINPKASRKFKMGIYNNCAESTVVNITWQISKDGKLTPVLNIEPIELCGSTITNVTGHNYSNLIDKQCGIGSKVKIKRAGLVIPYLEEVLTTSTDLNIPENTHQEGVDLYLDNKDIDEVAIQKLVHFAKTLDLDQAGEASMEKLLEAYPNLKDPVNMFDLTLGSFRLTLGVNGVKLFESFRKVYDEGITEAKLADACGAFGAGLGESLLSQIENACGKLVKLTGEIENFGPSRLQQYQENFDNWTRIKNKYYETGGKFKHLINKQDLPFNGYVICFTGIRDKEFAAYLEDNGAKVTESFNKTVNILIAKDPNGNSSKILKAKEQGCLIYSIEEAKIKLKI